MKKSARKTAEHLQVIHGKEKSAPKTGKGLSGKKRPYYILLISLALFLLIQVLAGWLFGYFGSSSVNTAVLQKGSIDLMVDSKGIMTFDEEVILAEQSGYVYFTVSEGKRVPRGKEVAVILDRPADNVAGATGDGDNIEARGHLEAAKKWLLGEQREGLDFPVNEKSIEASLPGVVSFRIDGLEKYGPDSGFPYFNRPDEDENVDPEKIQVRQGERVHRLMPVFKLIDNYYWYYSTVLPFEKGEKLAEREEVEISFSFAPEKTVTGKLEEEEKNNEEYRLTWRIEQFLKDFYKKRFVKAEIIYGQLEGTLVPSSAVVEKEGTYGVYAVKRGLVEFEQVNKLSEKEGKFLVEGLDDNIRVVKNPSRVKEGQRLY